MVTGCGLQTRHRFMSNWPRLRMTCALWSVLNQLVVRNGSSRRRLINAAGIAARQLPPTQIKAFAARRGTRAKTDRIDAELIARFMAFTPDAGRTLPAKKLHLLTL
jgi:transposase